MNPRIRRLQSDYAQVSQAFSSNTRFSLVSVEGNPPEKYVIEFRVAGLSASADSFQPTSVHRAEIFLSMDYPRRPPFCRMITPTFHPNIDPQKICIGDHWNAGQSLVQLIVRIAEMISFQSYNVKSPLNANAAAWAEQNESQLPLERIDLSAGI